MKKLLHYLFPRKNRRRFTQHKTRVKWLLSSMEHFNSPKIYLK